MEINDIKDLIDKINSSDLALFEIKLGDVYIKMDKSLTRSGSNGEKTSENISIDSGLDKESISNSIKEEKISVSKVKEQEIDNSNSTVIKSPMVGTFYGAPAPGKAPFIKEGDQIKKGQVLCIVEAMKLMNEITSEYDGVIKRILIKDGDMVEFGKPLFEVEGA